MFKVLLADEELTPPAPLQQYECGMAGVRAFVDDFDGYYDPGRTDDSALLHIKRTLSDNIRMACQNTDPEPGHIAQVLETAETLHVLSRTDYPDKPWPITHPRVTASDALLKLAVHSSPVVNQYFQAADIEPSHVPGIAAFLEAATTSTHEDLLAACCGLSEKIVTEAGLDYTALAPFWANGLDTLQLKHIFANAAAILELETQHKGAARQLFEAGTTRFKRSGPELLLAQLAQLNGDEERAPHTKPRFYAALMRDCHNGAAEFPGSLEKLYQECKDAGIELETVEFRNRLDLYKLALRIKWRHKLYGETVSGGVIVSHGTRSSFAAGRNEKVTGDDLAAVDLIDTGEAFAPEAKIGLLACGVITTVEAESSPRSSQSHWAEAWLESPLRWLHCWKQQRQKKKRKALSWISILAHQGILPCQLL